MNFRILRTQSFKTIITVPGMVVHTCNPSYFGMDIGGFQFEASLDKKLVGPYFKNSWAW
jgi:hypothetical protein